MIPNEALADCVMRFEGWFAPGTTTGGKTGSTSWRNRNPGNLRSSSLQTGTDSRGYAIFQNLNTGWQALCIDIQAKFNGSHGLTPQSTLTDLFDIYAPALDNNNPYQYSKQIAEWMTQIYGTTVLPTTTLEQILKLGA